MQMDQDDNKTGLSESDSVVKEAVERWKSCKDFQGVEDENCVSDIKFANGDARNTWQWPENIYRERTGDSGGESGVCLTINNTRVHNDLIINQLSKSNFGVKVRPTGGKATYESAKVMQSVIKRIEYISKFSSQRRKVAEQQVDGGIGYILIETAYVSSRTRNQDIYLKASRDPTAVYLDPYITEPDGSDANFGFVFNRMPRAEFNRKYPDSKDKVGAAPLNSMFLDWITDKEIMVVKYFRKKNTKDKLVWFKKADTGDEVEKLESELRAESGKDITDRLLQDIKDGRLDGGTRDVFNTQVEWFLIAGDQIIDKGDWAGAYIPICRCVGRELVINGTLDRKGMTRAQIDPQRMLNYNASMAVEMVAQQPKSPFMAPARAIEGQEQFKTLNINGTPVILYNDIDDEAQGELQRVAPPQRLDPPRPSEAHMQGMQAAERWGMMVSGQFQAQMGENDTQSAASGKAINERQQQGDTATYHFPEHQSDMLRFIGVQLLDLIPKIYDTERTLHIIDDKNEKSWIRIAPNQQDAIQKLDHDAEDEEAIAMAFNPSVGEYDCVSDPGPDYATQRQEAWNAMSMIMQNNKDLAATAADLLFKYGDFPGADEIMERLQKEIKAAKPYLFDEEANPQIVQLQQATQRLTALNSELMQKLAAAQLKDKGREEKRDIEASKADTDRMRVTLDFLTKVMLTPQQQAQMAHELERMSHEHVYGTIAMANESVVNADRLNGGGQSQ